MSLRSTPSELLPSGVSRVSTEPETGLCLPGARREEGFAHRGPGRRGVFSVLKREIPERALRRMVGITSLQMMSIT